MLTGGNIDGEQSEVGGRVDSRGLTRVDARLPAGEVEGRQAQRRRLFGAGAQREAKVACPQERRVERRCGVNTVRVERKCAIRPAGRNSWMALLPSPASSAPWSTSIWANTGAETSAVSGAKTSIHAERGCWLKTMRPMVAAVRVARRGVVRGCRATPPANNARGSERSASSRHANWMTDSTSMLSQRAAPRCP